ncbi:MAG: hypothetical protein ABI240_03890 [Sphingomonas sp.]
MPLRSACLIVSTLVFVALTPGIAADAPATIHMNQLGFEPGSAKHAIVNDPATGPLP